MLSEDLNSKNFEVGSSSESESEPGLSKADTSKHIFLSHTVFATFTNGISYRQTALRTSSVIQDAEIVTKGNEDLVIDKDKVKKAGKKDTG